MDVECLVHKAGHKKRQQIQLIHTETLKRRDLRRGRREGLTKVMRHWSKASQPCVRTDLWDIWGTLKGAQGAPSLNISNLELQIMDFFFT